MGDDIDDIRETVNIKLLLFLSEIWSWMVIPSDSRLSFSSLDVLVNISPVIISPYNLEIFSLYCSLDFHEK